MSGDVGLQLDRLIPGLANMKHDLCLKVGVLEGATNIINRQLVAEYAAMNEFGTRDIPSRPAMRTTLDKHGEEYARALGDMLMRGVDLDTALRALGEVIRGNVVESIVSWTTPPNAKKYAEWKRRHYNVEGDKPLYLTGAYAGSIAYEVVKDGTGEK